MKDFAIGLYFMEAIEVVRFDWIDCGGNLRSNVATLFRCNQPDESPYRFGIYPTPGISGACSGGLFSGFFLLHWNDGRQFLSPEGVAQRLSRRAALQFAGMAFGPSAELPTVAGGLDLCAEGFVEGQAPGR